MRNMIKIPNPWKCIEHTRGQAFCFKGVILAASSDGENAPCSVITAVISSAGVTSKAGFQQ